jgi:GNAT superfamily N-acetyltransferase
MECRKKIGRWTADDIEDHMEITYHFECGDATTPELVALFKAAGLGGRTGEKILRAFKNSQLVCLAYAGKQLVGCSRAITDWEYHALIYDVAVHPDYQGQGFGKTMLESLLSRLKVWRVMLVADGDVQPFYERSGFQPYPDLMAKLDWDNL